MCSFSQPRGSGVACIQVQPRFVVAAARYLCCEAGFARIMKACAAPPRRTRSGLATGRRVEPPPYAWVALLVRAAAPGGAAAGAPVLIASRARGGLRCTAGVLLDCPPQTRTDSRARVAEAGPSRAARRADAGVLAAATSPKQVWGAAGMRPRPPRGHRAAGKPKATAPTSTQSRGVCAVWAPWPLPRPQELWFESYITMVPHLLGPEVPGVPLLLGDH